MRRSNPADMSPMEFGAEVDTAAYSGPVIVRTRFESGDREVGLRSYWFVEEIEFGGAIILDDHQAREILGAKAFDDLEEDAQEEAYQMSMGDPDREED